MNKDEFLKLMADMLGQNVGNKITNELASGMYAVMTQNINKLKIKEEEDGESKNS